MPKSVIFEGRDTNYVKETVGVVKYHFSVAIAIHPQKVAVTKRVT